MRLLSYGLLGLLLWTCGSGPTQKQSEAPRLGIVSLEVTGHPDALPHFEQGLLLLHSFEYADATEAFDRAHAIDPNMPMALWGVAMCQNFPIWHYQHYEEGRAVLDSLDLLDREVTELEQDLIAAVRLLFAKNEEKAVRDHNYSKAMERLYGKYPNSDDVAAFYALSILGTVNEARDYEAYERAAVVAKEVIDRSPQHPGALHYYIHAYDDPIKAHKALDEAYAYAKVAPSAAHALHMPSHIFLALGLWDDLVASNVEAWAASHQRKEEKGLDFNALDYHSFHWLQYGYLQLGQADTAMAMARRMAAYTDSLPSKKARRHMVYMQSTLAAETDNYLSDIASRDIALDGLDIVTRAQHYHLAGMRAFQQNEADALKKSCATIEEECRVESLFLDTADFKICIELDREMPRQIDIDRAMVMAMQLRAHEALLEGDATRAEEWMLKASEKECRLDLYYGPPVVRKPSPELYGDWLRERGRHEDAGNQYAKALDRSPGRLHPKTALDDTQGGAI